MMAPMAAGWLLGTSVQPCSCCSSLCCWSGTTGRQRLWTGLHWLTVRLDPLRVLDEVSDNTPLVSCRVHLPDASVPQLFWTLHGYFKKGVMQVVHEREQNMKVPATSSCSRSQAASIESGQQHVCGKDLIPRTPRLNGRFMQIQIVWVG